MRKIIVICAAVLLLAGCKSVQQTVEVPVYIHDTAYTVKVQHDSTYIDRYHTEYVKGDTVFRVDSIDRWRVVYRTDTMQKVVEVPVQVTKTETVEVKKPLSWWQKTFIGLGVISLLVIFGWAAFRLLLPTKLPTKNGN